MDLTVEIDMHHPGEFLCYESLRQIQEPWLENIEGRPHKRSTPQKAAIDLRKIAFGKQSQVSVLPASA